MESSKIIIPAGTTLYRAADDICVNSKNLIKMKKICTNTGKIGLYMSTYLLQALAMAIEYDKDLQLGVFKTLKPISLTQGKYSFRDIHPERYYDNGKLILNVKPLKNEMISHINQTYPILSLLENDNEIIKFDNPLKENEGELFLTDDEDLKNIEVIGIYNIDLSKLKTHLKSIISDLGYLPLTDSNIYLKSTAITALRCGGRHKQKIRELMRTLKTNGGSKYSKKQKKTRRKFRKFEQKTRNTRRHTYLTN
jgi:hypothetical protein